MEHSRTLRTAVVPTSAAHVPDGPYSVWSPLRGGLTRTGTAILIGLTVEKERNPGKPGSYGVLRQDLRRPSISVTPRLPVEIITYGATGWRLA